MTAEIVGVHEGDAAVAQKAANAGRGPGHGGGDGAAARRLARKRWQGERFPTQPGVGEVPRKRTRAIMQDDQRPDARRIERAQQAQRGEVAAAHRIADERKADDGRRQDTDGTAGRRGARRRR